MKPVTVYLQLVSYTILERNDVLDQTVIRSFSNMGHCSSGRFFAGFHDASAPIEHFIQPRGVLRVSLSRGDMIQFFEPGLGAKISLAIFGKRGARLEDTFGNRYTAVDYGQLSWARPSCPAGS